MYDDTSEKEGDIVNYWTILKDPDSMSVIYITAAKLAQYILVE